MTIKPYLEEADYCIIGGGSAGCVVASRLSENPAIKVVLLEIGPRDWHPYIHIPAGCLSLQRDKRFNWLDRSEPQAHANSREIKISQGRVLGGSGSINGMLHVRPQRSDVDDWRTSGWSYEEVLPYFDKAETEDTHQNGVGESGLHAVSDFTTIHPLTVAFLDAAQSFGIPRNPTMNGPVREGVAPFQQNRRGRFRAQPAQTYLRRARRRPNLKILTGAFGVRVLLSGSRASGVAFVQEGQEKVQPVRQEVIVCTGALRSPQVLQLSGIGDPEHLRQIGIEPLVSAPSVGQNLRDHFIIRVGHRVHGVTTINERARGLPVVKEALSYALAGTGMLTMGAGAAAAFLRTRPDLPAPNVQLSFAPGSFASAGVLEKEPGMTIGGWSSPAASAGTSMARTASLLDPPAIDPNYLSAVADQIAIVECVRIIRRLFGRPELARWSKGETFPGPQLASDEDILDFARERGTSGLHFTGTCRMGDDSASVVDAKLQVRGVRGLRVIDASVIPHTPIGNTHATVVMVAEKGASMVLAASHIE